VLAIHIDAGRLHLRQEELQQIRSNINVAIVARIVIA